MKARFLIPYNGVSYAGMYDMAGTIYSSANVYSLRQGLYYKNTSGGSSSFVATLSAGTEALILTSPAGVGMIGDVTIEIQRSASYGTPIVVPRYTPEGLADRRVIYPLDGGTTFDITGVRITTSANSEISRVIGIEHNILDFDVTNYFAEGWKTSVESFTRSAMSSGQDYFWETAESETPLRFKKFEGKLQGWVHDPKDFRRVYSDRGYNREILFVPQWADRTESEDKLKLMHSSMVFGRFSSNYREIFSGYKKMPGSSNSYPIFEIPFQLKELI